MEKSAIPDIYEKTLKAYTFNGLWFDMVGEYSNIQVNAIRTSNEYIYTRQKDKPHHKERK